MASSAAAVVCGVSWIAVGRGPAPSPLTPSVSKLAPTDQKRATGDLVPATTGVPEGEGEIPFVSARAAAVQTPSAPDAWGGPRTGQEATLSDRVVKYEIAATLDPKAHTIEGQEKMTWRNRSNRPVKSIYLHMYLNAFEGPGSTFLTEHRENGLSFRSDVGVEKGDWGHIELKNVQQNGATVPWKYVHPDGGPDTDHSVVRFDLPEPVPAGGSTSVDIGFHDQLPRVVARTGWWGTFHMVAQWFPKVGVLELPGERGATAPRWNVHEFHLHSEFYADWGEYDVKMTVPKDYQVASAGEEVGAPVEQAGMTTHHFVQGDIHDFAWMAANDYAPPLEGSYDGPGSPHVAVRVFYPKEYVASAAPSLKATIDSIRYFSTTLGPYPYKTSTCIVPPFNAGEAGGMEYQTLFTGEGYSVVEPDTFTQWELDFVVIHEFGHGYFYGLLASNEFEEPLLDEGLNEYWDQRMLRARDQDVHITTPFLKLLGVAPLTNVFALERALGALDPHPPDPIGANSWDRFSSNSYGMVYSRTATVFHDLEERLGHDTIEKAFKLYYQRWHFRHPSTADLRQAIIDASGDAKTVDAAFRQNVYGADPVDDRVVRIVSDEMKPEPGTHLDKGKWVEDTEESVDKEIEAKRKEWDKAHPKAEHGQGPYPFRTMVTVKREGAPAPATLEVTFEDDSVERVQWDDDKTWRRFVFVKPFKAKSATLDSQRQHYLDLDMLNNGRRREPDSAASRRWGGDVAAFAEVIYSLLGAL